MESTLKKEFEYYLANQADFVKKFNGKVVVIKNCKVLGSYADEASAIASTVKDHELGTFLVQKVEPGTGAYTQSFHSRVFFAR